MIAGLFVTWLWYQSPAPATIEAGVDPAREIEVRVWKEKTISATETVRVLVMPSQTEPFGTLCLLYTNRETGAATLGCGREELLPEDSGGR